MLPKVSSEVLDKLRNSGQSPPWKCKLQLRRGRTALGPVLLGGLLKAGVTFAVIIPAAAVLGVAIIAVSVVARGVLLKQGR